MAIQTPKKKQGSNHQEMTNLVKNLARQLGPKKSSANTRIQGAILHKANVFFSDTDAVKREESSRKIKIHLAGQELTVSSVG
jgi:hypothetical protein